MNKNLPPIMVYVRNEFLFGQKKGFGEFTVGHLVSVRSLQNQCFQFSVLLGNGALFTGLPAHALAFKQEAPKRPLNESQMWDSISSSIDIIQLELLLYMPATIKLFSGELVKGEYLFTIDAVGTNDLSRHPIHWKQMHCFKTEEGNLLISPQYRVQFQDEALCKDFPLESYDFNEVIWTVGS